MGVGGVHSKTRIHSHARTLTIEMAVQHRRARPHVSVMVMTTVADGSLHTPWRLRRSP